MLHKKYVVTSVLCLLINVMRADFEIQESVFVPHDLGKVSLFHNDKGFKVFEESGVKHKVGNHNIDTILHKMDSDQLSKFLVYGYLALKKNDAGEYIIKAKVRGNGGGPVTASVLYWMTKSACYGTGATATAAVAVAAGTTAGGLGVAALVSSTNVAVAASAATATATVGSVVTGAVVAVETASLAAYAVGMWLPLP